MVKNRPFGTSVPAIRSPSGIKSSIRTCPAGAVERFSALRAPRCLAAFYLLWRPPLGAWACSERGLRMVSPWFAGAGVGGRLSAFQRAWLVGAAWAGGGCGRGPLVFESVPRAYRRGERPTSTIVCSSSVAVRWGAISSTLRSPHELRAAQVVIPHGEQVGFEAATLHVRRAKNGTSAVP